MIKVLQVQFTFNCYDVDLSDEELSEAVHDLLTYYSDGRYCFVTELLNEAAEKVFMGAVKDAIMDKYSRLHKKEIVQAEDGNGCTSRAIIEAAKEIKKMKIYLVDEPDSSVITTDED